MKKKSLENLVKTNGLDLTVNIPESVVVSRQKVRYRSIGSNLSQITFELSNGESWVAPQSSYLKFKVTSSGGDIDFTNDGGAWELFSTVRFIHNSGTELAHDKHRSRYQYARGRTEKTVSWKDVVGIMAGVNSTLVDGVTQTFHVPLNMLCSLFDSEMKYCPSYILAGGRFELERESASNLQGTATSFAFEDVELVMDELVLADDVINAMNSLSAKGDLVWKSYSYEEQLVNASGNQVSLQLSKSLGRVYEVLLTTQTDTSTRPEGNGGGASVWETSQFRINNTYFPAQECTDVKQRYLQHYDARHADGEIFDYTFTDYGTTTVVKQTLERNQVLPKSTSGAHLSSSSSLQFYGKLAVAPSANRIVTMWAIHCKMITPYGNQKVIVEM